MAKPRVTIVGLGLIGGSLGLALKESSVELELVGHDARNEVARRAHKRGAIDKIDWNLVSACDRADLVLIATPALAVKEVLQHIGPELKEGCVVSDTAGSKAQVVQWADELLPPGVSFVGGDPMVGAEGSGIDAARADLFKDKVYCLTPAAKAEPGAVKLVAGLVGLLGARPFFLDAAEHDGLVAAIDHLPFAMSAALLNLVAHTPSQRELRRMVGPTFHRATHLASTDPLTYRDLCLTNRDALLRWIDASRQSLAELRALIAEGNEKQLAAFFDDAFATREEWLKPVVDESDATASQALRDTSSFGLGSLFGIRPRREPTGKGQERK